MYERMRSHGHACARAHTNTPAHTLFRTRALDVTGTVRRVKRGRKSSEGRRAVSYTHLTLPTICSV
eukprot:7549251-Alexandrium_andersonii.AAC.1